MNKIQAKAKFILIYLLFITCSCSRDSKQTVSQASQQLCDCFGKQKGDIDAKMSPCVNDIANAYGHSKHTFTMASGTDSTAIKAKLDSAKASDIRFISAVTNNAIISCDALGSEVEAMYDRWYPVDSSAASLSTIQRISAQLNHQSVTDTIYKRLLHALIRQDIKARQLNLALQNCQKMKRIFPNERGAYFASAFVYNLQHKFSLASTEIKQAIAIEHSNDLELILAIIDRKAKRAKAERN